MYVCVWVFKKMCGCVFVYTYGTLNSSSDVLCSQVKGEYIVNKCAKYKEIGVLWVAMFQE